MKTRNILNSKNQQTSKIMHFFSRVDLGAGITLCMTKVHIIINCVCWQTIHRAKNLRLDAYTPHTRI